MKVKASAVVRVIIAGEWIMVEPGTFVIQDYTFVDDDGNELNRSHEPAYHFVSTNGDPYYGPLSAIHLIKLRPPELDASFDDSQEHPAEEQPAADAEETPSAESQQAADSLFADPVPMSSADRAEHSGGLL